VHTYFPIRKCDSSINSQKRRVGEHEMPTARSVQLNEATRIATRIMCIVYCANEDCNKTVGTRRLWLSVIPDSQHSFLRGCSWYARRQAQPGRRPNTTHGIGKSYLIEQITLQNRKKPGVSKLVGNVSSSLFAPNRQQLGCCPVRPGIISCFRNPLGLAGRTARST
jgi:hypothetical protein